ncbi:MAG: hypothetical protein O6944_06890 [Gammaproteobacteria bacterium]|nr:hypothetical protein [Gammaproteobacteria bacterium]
MTSKDRHYLFAIINVLLVFGGLLVFGVILSRDLPPPGLGPEDHYALIQKMTDINKLKDMMIRDNVYIRSLESFVSTSRFILLFSSVVGAAFGLINLVLMPWRSIWSGLHR